MMFRLRAVAVHGAKASTTLVRNYNYMNGMVRNPVIRKTAKERQKTNEEFAADLTDYEGDEVLVNKSLVINGIVPNGNAFHNLDLASLLKKGGVKPEKGVVAGASTPTSSLSKILEVGDNLDAATFESIKETATSYFENDLYQSIFFVEDQALGSHPDFKVGVRVITGNAPFALAMRNLMIPQPWRPVFAEGARKGWNLSGKVYFEHVLDWDGEKYVKANMTTPLKGLRPVTVYHAGNNGDVAMQFVEFKGEIVGADVIVGLQTPLHTAIKAIGTASSVVLNEEESNQAVCVPSAVFVKGGKSYLVINADDEVVSAAVKAGASLYGHYFNTISARGVSALFNGVVVDASLPNGDGNALLVKDGNKVVQSLAPDNLTFPASKIVLYDKENKVKDFTKAAAKEYIAKATTEKKEALIGDLLTNTEVGVINSASKVSSLFA